MKPPIFLLLRSLFLLLAIVSACIDLVSLAFNPYHVLGVPKAASVVDIKHAYKSLARKYHPDKNTGDDAQERFIELNKAYEILLDPERRRHYDRTGLAEESPNFRPQHDYSSFNRFDFDTFDTFFTGSNGQKFRFTINTGNYFRKHSITYKAYENTILSQSYSRPFIIVFYGDLCIPCVQFEDLMQKIMADLEAVGVGFATVHAQHESVLSQKLGVRSLPHLVSLVDGDVRQYRNDDVSLPGLIDFLKRTLPANLITTEVNDANYLSFLTGWRDNKVRVLFVNEDRLIKLRYKLVAFYFRERIAFGHVSADESSRMLRDRYHVDLKMNSMLIFNEDISRPLATLSLSDLKTQLMKDVLDSNKYLLLPRVTSQHMFDHLCPIGSSPTRVKLCVLLITSDTAENEPKFEAMRAYMRASRLPSDQYRFMYIYREKQTEFVHALFNGFKRGNPNRGIHLVILWRRKPDHVYYEWLESEWDLIDSTYLNETSAKLTTLLARLSTNVAAFSNEARLPSVIDEAAKSLISRLVKRLLLVTENLSDNIAHTDPVPIVSIILTVAVIIFIGLVMVHFMRLEEESIKQKRNLNGESDTTRVRKEDSFNVHELRGETYNGLVRLLKPGCRSIVLLCDVDSKPRLLAQFRKAVCPYRKNKTLLFAYLLVPKNIEWYGKILQQTLGEERSLNINPKNCIGTVISINGFRKYYCVYHAKHPETKHKRHTTENGQFLGLDDSEVSSDGESDVESGRLVGASGGALRCRRNAGYDAHEEIIFEENLLDGFSSWLEKLFDGTTIRYHINYWPEHMK